MSGGAAEQHGAGTRQVLRLANRWVAPTPRFPDWGQGARGMLRLSWFAEGPAGRKRCWGPCWRVALSGEADRLWAGMGGARGVASRLPAEGRGPGGQSPEGRCGERAGVDPLPGPRFLVKRSARAWLSRGPRWEEERAGGQEVEPEGGGE